MLLCQVLYHFDQMFRWRVTGGRELNKFDLGDGDIATLGLKMVKKRKNSESGKCRTSIYGNFLVIAEKWTLSPVNICGDRWHPVNIWSKWYSSRDSAYLGIIIGCHNLTPI